MWRTECRGFGRVDGEDGSLFVAALHEVHLARVRARVRARARVRVGVRVGVRVRVRARVRARVRVRVRARVRFRVRVRVRANLGSFATAEEAALWLTLTLAR